MYNIIIILIIAQSTVKDMKIGTLSIPIGAPSAILNFFF